MRAATLREALGQHRWYRRLSSQSVLAVLMRGAFSAFLIGIATRFVSFPVNIMMARSLGAENYGIFVFVANWVGIASLFALMGFETGIVRFMAAYRARGEFGLLRGLLIRARTLVFAGSTAAGVIVLSVVLLLGDRIDQPVRWTFLIVCASLPFAGQRVVQTVSLLALRRVTWSQTMGGLVPPLAAAVAMFALYLWRGEGIEAYEAAGIQFGITILLLAIGAWLVHKAAPKETWSAKPVYRTREWLRVSLPLLLVASMRQVLNRTSVILIGVLTGTTEAGIYAIVVNLARFTSFGLQATNTVASPLISELHTTESKRDMQRVFSLSAWSATVTSVAIGVALFVLQGPLLRLFGEEFRVGAMTLAILVAGRIIDAWTGPNGSLLNMTGHQDKNALILGACAVFNLVASIPAIHYWGIEGAAVVTGLAMVLKNAWTWIEVKRSIGLNASIFGALPWRR